MPEREAVTRASSVGLWRVEGAGPVQPGLLTWSEEEGRGWLLALVKVPSGKSGLQGNEAPCG